MCRFKVGDIVYLIDTSCLGSTTLKDKKYLRARILRIVTVAPNRKELNLTARQLIKRFNDNNPVFLFSVVFEDECEFNQLNNTTTKKERRQLLSTRFGTQAEAVAAKILDED